MAKQTINLGSVADDGTGSTLRAGGTIINANFDEIYTTFGDGTTLISGTVVTTTANQTLTTKSIALGSNTITGTTAEFNTALTDNDFATLAGSEALTNKNLNSGTNTFPTTSIAGVSISIGGTYATPAFDLTNATNYPTSSLTGTITNAQLAGSIENSKLLNSTITIGDNTSTNFNVGLGESFEIVGISGITTSITNNRIQLSVTGLTNSNLSGTAGITNANLSTSGQLILGSTTLELGTTDTTVADLSLTGSSSLSGTGTVNTTGGGNRLRFNVAGFGSLPTASTYEGMFAYDTVGLRPYYADSGGWVRILDENSSVSAHADVNITGIADEETLVWSSSSARFNAIPQKISSAAEIDVTNNGSSNYLFDSHYSGANPTLYLSAGQTYALKLNVSGHPFHLQTVSGAYSSGNAYTTGLTHIATDGTVTTGSSALLKETGTLYIEVPSDTSTTIYYACQYHSGMAGSIVLGPTFKSINLTGDINEKITTSATAATGTVNFDVVTQNVLYYTTDASADWTLNIRGDSSTTLNNIMDTGQACTIAFLVTQGGTAYYNNALTIDGSSVTPKYRDGSAYTSGNANGIDLYTYTIIKTGSAAFTVLASQTQYA